MRCVWVLALVTVAMSARASAEGEEDTAKADKLFDEAQQLKQAGKLDEACNKYSEALTFNRNAVGTLLNVAKCAEDAGKYATAVKHYTQARDLAREHSLAEHRTAAEQRLSVVAPKVPRLAIAFTERPDNMKLVIDDEVFPTDAQSTNELRLDPGTRHVVVTAPGRVPYDTTVTLVEGKQEAIAIPKLGHPVTVTKSRRTVGKVLTFSGAGLLLTGVVLGIVANRDYETPFEDGTCKEVPNDTPLCQPMAYERTNSAWQLAWTGTIVGGVGLGALAVGAVLWFTAPAETSRDVAVVPSVTNQSAGLAAVGRF
jgi:hypothetical protein